MRRMKDSLRRLASAQHSLERLRKAAAHERAAARGGREPAKRSAEVHVTRAEFEDLVAVVGRRGEIVTSLADQLDVQFKRIVQLQEEVDELRGRTRRGKPDRQ